MSLTAAALRRPVTTVAATIVLVLFGAVSLTRLPVSLLPDITLPVLTIRTQYPGSAAPEVSRFVAEPVEEAIAATPGLVELRSVSRNDQASTVARFAWGTDMRTTVLDVRERLDNARAALPERAGRPTLLTSDPGERPIAILALTGAQDDLRTLARTAYDVHARRLEQLSGVASVAIVGAPKQEIRIDLDPDRLRALELSPGDVARSLKDANAGAPGGTVRRGQFRFSVRTLTEFGDTSEIGDTPVGRLGTGLRLRDIGTVSIASAEPQNLARFDGRPALGLVVYKDAGANTVAATRDLYGAVDDLRREFPDAPLTVVAAQAGFVTDALSNLAQEIVAGGILSLLIIVLLLGEFRGALAVGLIVPLSVLVSLTLLQALHVTINVLSLGGLALGVGLLVDNAIVVAEATARKREQGVPAIEAARTATEEVTGPLIAGTLTTVLVFGPIVFVRGLAGALFRDLSLSVVASLGASLVLALTLLPVMIAGQERSGPKGASWTWWDRFNERLASFGRRCADLYERGMEWSLARPRRVFAIAVATVIATMLIAMRLPREVLPQVDERAVVAALRLREGTALQETARQAARLEEASRRLGAKGVYGRLGTATDEEILVGADPGSASTAQFVVPVPVGADGRRFADALRRELPDLAQGALALDLAGQSEFGSLLGREGRVVRLEVTAAHPADAERWADTARAFLRTLGTLADVRDAYSASQPVIEVTLERDQIARRGLDVSRVAEALAGGLGGVAASELRETDRRIPITVRLAGRANENVEAALATVIGGVPLARLVSVREARAPTEVVRVNQRPVTVVEAVVERGGLPRARRDIGRVLSHVGAAPGVSWNVGGAESEERRTTSELFIVALLSVALMYLVLAGESGSLTTPLLVMVTVPLAAAGGIALLWITGQSLNVVSLIGLVVMIGLADNEAVVKLEAIRRFRSAGHPVREAVILGGRLRLRAIAMTSLTTVVGVLPLVLGIGSGGQLYQPLAAGVIGGSITATLVTFFLLPTGYVWVEERKARRKAGRPG